MKQRSWRWGCLVVALGCAVISYGYRLYNGYVPLSNLPVQMTEDTPTPKQALLDDTSKLWPPFYEQPFPPLSNAGKVYSPDGQFYIQLSEAGLCLFESVTHRTLGCYSFYNLIIYRWAEDSSGVYLSDYVPGEGSIAVIVNYKPAYISPVKKVLVPCRSSLEGVSLLPRLYWEMRCAFPEPYDFAAIWLPLVVLIALIAMGSWGGGRVILWLWRRWVRPWWYGE